jgi:hypothetical protein
VDGRQYRAVPVPMCVPVAPVHQTICDFPLSSSMVVLLVRGVGADWNASSYEWGSSSVRAIGGAVE